MIWLWLFWIEVVAFSCYVLWSLLGQGRHWSGYQWADFIIYGIAFIYSLYGLIGFTRRRLAARRLKTPS